VYFRVSSLLNIDSLPLKPFSYAQTFFNGKLLGNAETIGNMNESGKLSELLANVPKVSVGDDGTCSRCGGHGFYPVCRKGKPHAAS
jgi:hypothetical protein